MEHMGKAIETDETLPLGVVSYVDRLFPLLPIALALLLCVPDFRYPFLFDDYDFLYRAGTPGWSKFLPQLGTIFWRPLSREGYFGLLHALGASTLAGHILNFGLLVAAILLMYSVVDRLRGRVAAGTTSILFATFGQLPILVGWVSGCQDLLAIDFLLLALWFQVQRHRFAAVVAAALALVSKEIALAAFPGLMATDYILGRDGARRKTMILGYAGTAALWGASHPATHILIARHFMGAATGYLGLDNPDRWQSLLRACSALFNVPPPGTDPVWLASLSLPVAIGACLLFATWPILRRSDRPGAETTPPGRGRIVLLGLALAIPPLVLTSVLVRHWTPYYAAVPAVGGCIALSALVPARPGPGLLVALVLWFALGAWARGVRIDPEIPTEVNLTPQGRALKEVRRQFLGVRPSLPDSAQVLVYVMAQGSVSIYPHMYRFKVLRHWYRDRSIEVFRPDLRPRTGREEFLFWISPDLTVHEVELNSLRPRSVAGRADYLEYQRTLRAYARGLADSGELDQAVRILLRMPEVRTEYQNLDHRIAAMLLFKYGRERDGSRILGGLPPFPKSAALGAVVFYLAKPARVPLPVSAPMMAFGLSPDDPEALRAVLRALRAQGAYEPAAAVGEELLRLEPWDPEARTAIEGTSRGPAPDLLTVPTP